MSKDSFSTRHRLEGMELTLLGRASVPASPSFSEQPRRSRLAGTLAPFLLSLAWDSQNTDFRTWRWNQYERQADVFFLVLATLRLGLVVTGVPANKPSSFWITCWGGSWLNSSSMMWSLSAWNDTARFT